MPKTTELRAASAGGKTALVSPALTATISVIGACWYLPPQAFEKLSQKFVSRVFGANPTRRYFVDMKGAAPERPLHTSTDDCVWLQNRGAFLDVSAYAHAAERINHAASVYLIFNDTLFTRHPWRLISQRLSSVRDSVASSQMKTAAGVVHPSTDLLVLDVSNPTRRHLSTFCLLLNQPAFKLFCDVLSQLPTIDAGRVAHWIDKMMDQYPCLAPLLHVHLYGPRSPWSWKQGKVSSDSDLLQRKAVTVIFEYLFTMQLLGANGVGMPINYDIEYKLRSRLRCYG